MNEQTAATIRDILNDEIGNLCVRSKAALQHADAAARRAEKLRGVDADACARADAMSQIQRAKACGLYVVVKALQAQMEKMV